MIAGFKNWLVDQLSHWLTKDTKPTGTPLCDFDRISLEIRPCDVLLVEGTSKVSNVIKVITQSPWTHTSLYLGRIHEIEDPDIREQVLKHYNADPGEQLILEALLGKGTIITTLSNYKRDNVRICRPTSLSRQDSQKILAYCIRHLGCDYDVRQLLDLARFMFPYSVLPRRWRSSLFQHNAGGPTRTVCSSLIAAAFSSVHFPILPVVQKDENGDMHLYKRNFRLYTPSDFDYSPYFDIIKYPYLGLDDFSIYRKLPWDHEGMICNDENDCFVPEGIFQEKKIKQPSQPIIADEPETQKGYPIFNMFRSSISNKE